MQIQQSKQNTLAMAQKMNYNHLQNQPIRHYEQHLHKLSDKHKLA